MNIFTNTTRIFFTFKLHLLAFTCLPFLWLASCGGGQEKDAKNGKPTEEKKAAPIPEALANFDKAYVGKWGNAEILLNLHRYGNDLWGNYWVKGKDAEYNLKGLLEDDGVTFKMDVFGEEGKVLGYLTGSLANPDLIKGNWLGLDTKDKKEFQIATSNVSVAVRLQLDEVKVSRTSGDGNKIVQISYPQLSGIEERSISDRVNYTIEKYFHTYTKVDSVEKVNYSFKEDVKYDITYLGKEIISICKNHHLSRNNDTQLFDDSHGVNINFKKGKVYQIRDLFKANALDQLNEEIAKRVNKLCNNSLSEEELKNCKLKPEEINSFSLTKDKITFHLTERLPYKSRGCGYVKISFEDLKDYLNPSSPLLDLMKK